MSSFLDVLTLLSLFLIFTVLRSVRREHIRVEYSVSWLAASLVLFLLSRSPAAASALSAWLGIHETSTSIIFLIVLVFLAVFYRFSLRISDLKDNNIALAQRVAILEYHLTALRRRMEGS